jgi:tetratricopeptide (TPR) repeat protein
MNSPIRFHHQHTTTTTTSSKTVASKQPQSQQQIHNSSAGVASQSPHHHQMPNSSSQPTTPLKQTPTTTGVPQFNSVLSSPQSPVLQNGSDKIPKKAAKSFLLTGGVGPSIPVDYPSPHHREPSTITPIIEYSPVSVNGLQQPQPVVHVVEYHTTSTPPRRTHVKQNTLNSTGTEKPQQHQVEHIPIHNHQQIQAEDIVEQTIIDNGSNTTTVITTITESPPISHKKSNTTETITITTQQKQSYSDSRLSLSQSHWLRKSRYLEKMKHHDEAIVALLFAMAATTDKIQYWKLFLRASMLYQQIRNNDVALRTFNTCIRLYDNEIGLLARAILYVHMEHYDNAVFDLDEVISLTKHLLDDHMGVEPSETEYKFRLIIALCTKANVLCCHKAVKAVRDIPLNESSTNENMYDLLEENTDFQEGLKYYNEAIELDPSFQLIYFYRGSAFRLFNVTKTLQDYNYALDISQESIMYSFRAAVYEDALNENEQALQDYNKAIELDSSDSSYYLYRAHLFEKVGQYEEAKHDYDTVIDICSSEVEEDELSINNAFKEHGLYFGLCARGKLSCDHLNAVHEGLDDYNRAIQLDSREPRAYVLRAMLHRSLNEEEMCRQDMQMAMELEEEY